MMMMMIHESWFLGRTILGLVSVVNKHLNNWKIYIFNPLLNNEARKDSLF
jgi:hypothetical protein